MESQRRPRRKSTGGLYHQAAKKKKRDLARSPSMTGLGTTSRKIIRTRGGSTKVRLLKENMVNLTLQDGTKKKVEILNVADNPANKHLSRRNIMTKSAVIDTTEGKARVTSRPGQDGVVNAVLIQQKTEKK